LASNIETAFEVCPLTSPNEKYDIKAIIETGDFTCIPAEHDNECDCADCAKCGKCNHGTGEITVVKIHSAGEADLKTYREKSRKAS
jgi:hypothetical protein